MNDRAPDTPIVAADLFSAEDDGPDMLDLAAPLIRHRRALAAVTFLSGCAGLAVTFALTPIFTASATFIPPQQQQSSASAALASLGALAGLAGGAQKSPGDQYISMMQSETVDNRIIDRFDLVKVYDTPTRFLARERLDKLAQITLGKKDGLITVAVQDVDPKRAAAIANQYIEELRAVTATLATTEAQSRRMLFEKLLFDTKVKLTAAQTALQASGYSPGALKSEPKSAAEGYARVLAELRASEVALQTRRESMADTAPEVMALAARTQALREQVHAAEQADVPAGANADYVSKYREYKYQETLFELMARQYELARVDEAREGALIQVVDKALVPDHKSWPKRGPVAIACAFIALLVYGGFLIGRDRFRASMRDPARAQRWAAFRAASARR